MESRRRSPGGGHRQILSQRRTGSEPSFRNITTAGAGDAAGRRQGCRAARCGIHSPTSSPCSLVSGAAPHPPATQADGSLALSSPAPALAT